MSNRPDSERLIELHVYVVPSALWQDKLRSAVNQVISETISAGFIRLFQDADLSKIRQEIKGQLGNDIVPRDFIFCKSVGRCITQVRPNQESNMKAFHFLPPNSYCPELFLLDLDTAARSTPSIREAYYSCGLGDPSSSNNNGNFYNQGSDKYGGAHDSSDYINGGGGGGGNYNGGIGERDYPTINIDGSSSDAMGNDAGASDYFKSAMADIEKSQSQNNIGRPPGKINLNDYPSLTNEEIRMMEGMTEDEKWQYLLNKGLVNESGNGGVNGDPQVAIVIDNDLMYEEDGPQRGGGGKVNSDYDQDFDDSNMSEMEKYFSPITPKTQRQTETGRDSISNAVWQTNQSWKEDEEMRLAADAIMTKQFARERGLKRPPVTLSPPSSESGARNEYEHYIELLEKLKSGRSDNETRKLDLIKRAKQLYSKTANQKNIARDMWKKKYFEEKKRTSPLEDHLNKQQNELDGIHRKILTMMENMTKEKKSRGDKQSSIDLSRMRIQAKKLECEIEEAQRGVDEAKLKLTCEIKMTHQARAELVALRADLVQKKINLSMARNQQITNMAASK